MRRAAPTLPVSPKLFRHFAIVTVVLTAGLAMFADGENREALTQAVETQKAKSTARQAERSRLGNHKRIGGPRQAAAAAAAANDVPVDEGGASPVSYGGGGSSDGDAGWIVTPGGSDMAGAGASGGLAPGASGPDSGNGPPGRKKAKQPTRPSQRQIEAMLAASRARASGGRSDAAREEEPDEEE